MNSERNRSEVRFYIDRMREVTTRIVKSVVMNPRLSPDERLELLHEIAHEHAWVANFIVKNVLIGEEKSQSRANNQ